MPFELVSYINFHYTLHCMYVVLSKMSDNGYLLLHLNKNALALLRQFTSPQPFANETRELYLDEERKQQVEGSFEFIKGYQQ